MKKFLLKVLGWFDILSEFKEIVAETKKDVTYINKMYADMRKMADDLSNRHKYLVDFERRIKEMFGVGVDFHPSSDENWAVICLKGKPEYVRFVDLRGKDVRELQLFLKHFGSPVIDAPFGIAQLFRDGGKVNEYR